MRCRATARSVSPRWKYTHERHAHPGRPPQEEDFAWPVAETDTHWITVGLDKDLNVAMTQAARNAIKFLATRTTHRARRLRPVQHRGELPGYAGGGHRAWRSRHDSQEPVRGPAAAADQRRLIAHRRRAGSAAAGCMSGGTMGIRQQGLRAKLRAILDHRSNNAFIARLPKAASTGRWLWKSFAGQISCPEPLPSIRRNRYR